ncbi:MAG: discoidin domain-containing protein, partial [Psychroflexus sp.]
MKKKILQTNSVHLTLMTILILFVQLGSRAQPSWPTPDPSNIALFKPAKQINTFEAGHANRAVDGNTDGHWHRGSVSHTNGSQNPWWEVNLLEEFDISSITVYNRTDCCPDRLKNFSIRVSPQPFEGNYGGEVFNNEGAIFSNSKTFTNAIRGQYVRIYMEDPGILSLAEVVVNGTPVNPERILKKDE